jgi:RNA polymerase sigma-70 factor (ECF subfamily)
VVRPFPSPDRDTSTLVERVRNDEPGAAGRLYDLYVDEVHGLVFRLLGPDPDLDDVVQEIFISALSSIHKLREPSALRAWLFSIAVARARSHIRSKRRKRWLVFLSHEDLPEKPVQRDDHHDDTLREVCAILDRMPEDQRVAFVLHRIQGLPLHIAAEVAKMSGSTFKRRLARADASFLARAERSPTLAPWIERQVAE